MQIGEVVDPINLENNENHSELNKMSIYNNIAVEIVVGFTPITLQFSLRDWSYLNKNRVARP